MDVRKPAEYTFPMDIRNVVLVNNIPPVQEEEGQKYNLNNFTKLDVDSLFLVSLCQYMNEEKFFDTVMVYPQNIYERNVLSDSVYVLPQRVTKEILEEKNAQLLITLDYIQTYIQKGNFMRNPVHAFIQNVLIQFYDREQSGKYHPIIQSDTLIILSTSPASEYILEVLNYKNIRTLGNANNHINELTCLNADALTSILLPSWEKNYRIYYGGLFSQKKKAADFAEKDKWVEAAEIWGQLYHKEKKKNKKIQLALNLALANEMLDDITYAKEWTDTAISFLDEKDNSEMADYARKYQQTLEKRRKNISTLNNQLKIDKPDEETITIDFEDIDIDEYNRR